MARQHTTASTVCESCGAVAHLHDASLGPLRGGTLHEETGYT